VFTCTASCAHATGSCTCAAEGRTKSEAKTAAAAGLLDQITEHERSAAAQLARAAEAEVRSTRGIFGRLLRAGCALDFRDRRFEVTGPAGAALEGPLAGFTVPLLEVLPVLSTLDGPAADGSAVLLHESARAWARAARSALEAVAARRVYPALDAAGHDCWRLAGSAADDGFTDAVAEALLRPPGARLVIGDLPYAGRARVLDGDAAEWADRCAEAADPTSAAAMSLRVQPPASAGSPLTAELHAPRLGHPEHRVLRRAARDWPPLDRIRRDGTLGGGDAAEPGDYILSQPGCLVRHAALPGRLPVREPPLDERPDRTHLGKGDLAGCDLAQDLLEECPRAALLALNELRRQLVADTLGIPVPEPQERAVLARVDVPLEPYTHCHSRPLSARARSRAAFS
jgi:hypothetical protein